MLLPVKSQHPHFQEPAVACIVPFTLQSPGLGCHSLFPCCLSLHRVWVCLRDLGYICGVSPGCQDWPKRGASLQQQTLGSSEQEQPEALNAHESKERKCLNWMQNIPPQNIALCHKTYLSIYLKTGHEFTKMFSSFS